MKIKEVKAIEILDSRGNPTVRTFIFLEDGSSYSSSVPSGASTGKYEAVELRDNDPKRYYGRGATKAVDNVNSSLNQAITGMDIENPKEIDQKMLELDGTENKEKIGANAILSVSQAALKAAAGVQHLPLWKHINQYYFAGAQPLFPRLMVNIVNGGKHAGWNFDIQEFMIVPKPTPPSSSVRIASEIFQSLGSNLKSKNLSTLVGDEGGYSPALSSNEEVLDNILKSAQDTGYNQDNFDLALDCAASEWIKDGSYISHKSNAKLTSEELIAYYLKLQEQYKILSFEDPFSEDDWESYAKFTVIANHPNSHAELVLPKLDPTMAVISASSQSINPNQILKQVQNDTRSFMVVGDDLFVTNQKRIQRGIDSHSANAVLIKVNQIGSVLETVDAIKMTQKAGWKTIISHRSGETEDSFIADLSYAAGADFIKTGSMSRSERLAKYNRLLEIENNI